MKAQIHPQYFDDARVVCSCGNRFTVGSTKQEIHVELCDNCHPFYTGTMKLLDTAGRVDAFKAKMAGAKSKLISKSEKRRAKKDRKLQEESARPTSLSELRK